MTYLKLKQKIDCLPQNAKILDAGGWFKPFPLATHVVDLMPWETREAKLQLKSLPDERFTKQTWHQINFLQSDLKLPFDDKYFDFSICSHTLEDLEDPLPLIHELARVSRAGYIEVPSRLHEQTVGVSNRASHLVGHPHHHWVIDREENQLVFYRKISSSASYVYSYAIPLNFYERMICKNSDLSITYLFWEEQIKIKFAIDNLAENKAREFKQSLNMNLTEPWLDKLIRFGRRTRDSLIAKNSNKERWWKEIVDLSRPYTSIELG